LALFKEGATIHRDILQVGGTIMADDKTANINAIIAFYNQKRLEIQREFQAEIEQIDRSLEQLHRWIGASPQTPMQEKPKLKRQEGKTVRDIVLAHVDGKKTSFKLAELVEQVIESGAIQGESSAIYGTITSMLRRNPHIFAKVRRGIWRVKSANQADIRAMSENEIKADLARALNLSPETSEQSDEERSETPVH